MRPEQSIVSVKEKEREEVNRQKIKNIHNTCKKQNGPKTKNRKKERENERQRKNQENVFTPETK